MTLQLHLAAWRKDRETFKGLRPQPRWSSLRLSVQRLALVRAESCCAGTKASARTNQDTMRRAHCSGGRVCFRGHTKVQHPSVVASAHMYAVMQKE